MKFQRFFLLLLAIAIGTSTGCRVYRTNPKPVECPPPEQNCFPGDWSGIGQDTSVETSKLLGFYYAIDRVKQINSPDNEWCLSFLDGKHAAITFSDLGMQRMMIVRKVRPDRFSLESGIYIPKDNHVGALSVSGNKAVFASIPSEEIVEAESDLEKEIDEDSEGPRAVLPEEEEEYEGLILYELPYYEIMGNADLYAADYNNFQLRNVEWLGEVVNFDQYTWESHPSLSPDGNVLFFSSDRPGGYGGTDIWYCIKLSDGSWSSPMNPGDKINTRCDEITPFVSTDGNTLLFSSAGHKTVGGYDIFESEIKDFFWKDAKSRNSNALKSRRDYFINVKNMRPPVNTESDEIFPSSPTNPDSLLYYSSNQSPGRQSIVLRRGGFDIYVRYRKPSPYEIADYKRTEKDVEIAFGEDPELEKKLDEPDYDIVPFYTVYGTVYNAETLEPVPNAEITIRELPGTETSKETTTDAAGEYQVDLDKDKEFEVTAQAKDLFFDSFKMRVEKEDTITRIKKDIFLPLKMELRINFPLDVYSNPYKYVLDSNGVESNKTWQQEINKLADNIKTSGDKLKKVILVGHTDYLGSKSYNKRLGMRRVNFIIKELIKRGVPETMLEGRSAGEEEPLLKRKGEDKKMYRKRLRRVTLEKVLKT